MNSARTKLQSLFADKREIRFKPQETIMRAGDEITHLYLIVSGYIEQRGTTPDGEEFVFAIYEEGAIITMTTYMENKHCAHDFIALTDVVVKLAPAEETLNLVLNDQEILTYFFTNFAKATTQCMLRMESLVFGGAKQKIAAILFLMASKFGKTDEDSKEIAINFPLTHKKIGMMAGLSRETVSAEMMKLKKEDIVYYSSGKVSILNLEKLLASSALSHYA
ncbi:MAG: hypothetical protein COU65_03365 [Candidatus Pacebacteria bacterium CG10_big_fil_rev_8_21_14_0_10_42_12]|nr:MAG: hypothetical protein COU65_03365 [Candidatus Pacebacteria bacterium CG10_big_fil_rev_8_21_14_0_10_42_12]